MIAQVLYDIGLIERYGSGIHRILETCLEENLPEPIFENFSGGFRTRFSLPESAKTWLKTTSTKQAQHRHTTDGGVNVPTNEGVNVPINVPINMQIRALVNENPGIQRKAIAQALHVTEKTVSRHLSTLINDGEIEHRGSNKTGGYYPTQS